MTILHWTKGTFGLYFGDDDRQTIRQNTSLKTAFAGACDLKYLMFDILFWQLKEVIERAKNRANLLIDSLFTSKTELSIS